MVRFRFVSSVALLTLVACGGTDLTNVDPAPDSGAGTIDPGGGPGPDRGADAARPVVANDAGNEAGDGGAQNDATPADDAAPGDDASVSDGGPGGDDAASTEDAALPDATPAPGDDAATDATVPPIDAAPPPPVDAGAPGIDAGTDAHVPSADASPPIDSGAPPDATVPPPHDAGPPPIDAAPPPFDAGPPPIDAAPPPPVDAGDDAATTCAIPASAFTAPDPTYPAPPAENPPFGDEVREIAIAVNGLVYDPHSRYLFASTPSSVGSNGNAILTIDPVTATIVEAVFVGSEPTRLALSRDGQFVYTNLRGADAIARYDVAKKKVGLQFSLGEDAYHTPQNAFDLQVLPSSPHAVVAALGTSNYNYYGTVAVFDDGVPRPVTTATYAYPYYGPSLLLASNSDALVFGVDSQSQANLGYFCVDAHGVQLTESHAAFTGSVAQLVYSSPDVYASTGGIFNAATRTEVGTFNVTPPSSYAYGSAIAVDTPANRAYLLSTNGAPPLEAFDQTHFTPAGSLASPPLPNANGTQLVRWGRYGLAYVASDGHVVLVRSTLVAQH
jgi:hypothetical protein